mmetsp:Transcript_61908/g.182873  ORF Transcript_61908/g.182873 Transcript_61908/m.182873 type:complete len:89 (-) Transcript_61908:564-830(-)
MYNLLLSQPRASMDLGKTCSKGIPGERKSTLTGWKKNQTKPHATQPILISVDRCLVNMNFNLGGHFRRKADPERVSNPANPNSLYFPD